MGSHPVAAVTELAAWSWDATSELAWPVLSTRAGGGYLIREHDEMVDKSRRIDGYWIHPSGVRHPIAVRCQDGFGGEYETFTVRDSEYAGLSGMPPVWGPTYHVQSYVSGDRRRLLASAIAESWELLAYIDLNRSQPGFWRPGPDHLFAVVPWRDLATVVIARGAS